MQRASISHGSREQLNHSLTIWFVRSRSYSDCWKRRKRYSRSSVNNSNASCSTIIKSLIPSSWEIGRQEKSWCVFGAGSRWALISREISKERQIEILWRIGHKICLTSQALLLISFVPSTSTAGLGNFLQFLIWPFSLRFWEFWTSLHCDWFVFQLGIVPSSN